MNPEYEYGVQWVTKSQIITTGPKDVCEGVIESIQGRGIPQGRFVLVRRPKGDWEEVP